MYRHLNACSIAENAMLLQEFLSLVSDHETISRDICELVSPELPELFQEVQTLTQVILALKMRIVVILTNISGVVCV